MNNASLKLLSISFKDSLPIMVSYIPFGCAYGVLFSELGFHWMFCALSSIFIYSGTIQLLTIGFVVSYNGWLDIILTVLAINFKHLIYGISFLERYNLDFFKKLYLVHTLTDETYSILVSFNQSTKLSDSKYCLFLSSLNHFYWVASSTLGAIFGPRITFNLEGVEFILTSLFLVSTIEQYKSKRSLKPIIAGMLACTFSIIFISSKYFLIASYCLTSFIYTLIHEK